MQYYFDTMPTQRWQLFIFLAISYPANYVLAFFLGDQTWLVLAVLTPFVGELFVSGRVGVTLGVVNTLFFIFAAIRSTDSETQAVLMFYIIVTWLMIVFGYFYRYKKLVHSNAYQDHQGKVQEELTLLREQYKNDLMISVANKKKYEKYTLLNRMSNAFGAQLQITKLVKLMLSEVQNLIGPERGRFIIHAFQGRDKPDLIINLPENKELNNELVDQFTEWIGEHKIGLLITDTKNDFRFHALKSGELLRSLMIAPMVINGEIKGFIRIESPWPNLFNVDDLRLLTIVTDIAAIATENARLYQQQEELAITDGLTGLYLRRFFNQRFEEEINRYQVHGIVFSLMIIDVDYFKHINDRLGHLAGDQVLVQLTRILQQQVRSIDILSRYGGEEFALLLPNTNAEGALVMAERIRRCIEKTKFIAINQTVKVTISIGVGECPLNATTINKLIKATDHALYGAKRTGRNQVTLASTEEKNRE